MPQNNVKVTLNPFVSLKFTSNIHINKHILGHSPCVFCLRKWKRLRFTASPQLESFLKRNFVGFFSDGERPPHFWNCQRKAHIKKYLYTSKGKTTTHNSQAAKQPQLNIRKYLLNISIHIQKTRVVYFRSKWRLNTL